MIAAALLLLCAGLGACSAGAGVRGADNAADVATEPTGSAAEAQPGGSGGSPQDSSAPAAAGTTLTGNRDLIRIGQLAVTVSDLGNAAARARALVAAQGGQISAEDSVLDGSSHDKGPMPGSFVQIVIALPPDGLDAAMTSLGELGMVSSRAESVEDVTLQVVDLQSRAVTLRASVERVRALMDRAQTIADIVALEAELARREADLASLTGQLESLQAQSALSSLTLTLTAASSATDAPSRDDGPMAALTRSVRALIHGARALVIGLAAAAPFAIIAALLGSAAWVGVRAARRRAGD